MSVALLNRWPTIQASLIHHATEGMTDRSCSRRSSEISRSLGVAQPLGLHEGAVRVDQNAKKLVIQWAQLNHRSFYDRYTSEKRTRKPAKIGTKGEVVNLHQLLKFLQCARYNTEDTDIAEETEARRMLEEVIASIERALIERALIEEMPEHRDAEWF